MEDEKTKGTAPGGSDPSKLTAKPGAEPGKDPGASGTLPPEGEKLPFDQHPKWQSARKAEKQLQDLMKANDCETAEELLELVDAGQKVRGKQIDIDQIDSLIEKASKLDQYEAYWQEQAELKRRGEEDPDQTIQRLHAEKKGLEARQRQQEAQRQAVEQAKEAAEAYDNEVRHLVDGMENIPEAERPYVYQFFGVDNPASTIDITDRKAVRKTVADGVKLLEKFREAVIQNYVKGKGQIPRVPGPASAPEGQPPRIANLREARRATMEMVEKATKGA